MSGLVAVLVAFADGGWQLALAVLALVIGVQFTEGTFLQPIIQSSGVTAARQRHGSRPRDARRDPTRKETR